MVYTHSSAQCDDDGCTNNHTQNVTHKEIRSEDASAMHIKLLPGSHRFPSLLKLRALVPAAAGGTLRLPQIDVFVEPTAYYDTAVAFLKAGTRLCR